MTNDPVIERLAKEVHKAGKDMDGDWRCNLICRLLDCFDWTEGELSSIMEYVEELDL